MRSMILLQSVLLIFLFSGCATLSEQFTVSYDPPKADAYWVERNPPTAALNDAEALAVMSATIFMSVQELKESAYYEGRDASFTLVRHEQLSLSEESYLITVKYRIRDGLVYGETIPFVVAMHDPKKEGFAKEVAFAAANGTTPAIPQMYDGRMFIAKKNLYNCCTVDVVEKDQDKEYTTYRIKTC